MRRISRKERLCGVFLTLLVPGGVPRLSAQQIAYKQSNPVANVAGVASHTDAQLSSPWGISFLRDNSFWIANNNDGTSTLYDAQGNRQSREVTTLPLYVPLGPSPTTPRTLMAAPFSYGPRLWACGFWLWFTVGCGSPKSKTSTMNNVTVMMTKTCGAISHATPVTLTIR